MGPTYRTRRLLAVAYALTLTTSTLVPGGGPGRSAPWPLGVVGIDMWLHLVGFLVLGALAAWAARDDRERVIGAVLAVALGGAIELAQGPVAGRHPALLDALADAAGAVLGMALVSLRFGLRGR
ncbi:MAG: VanZ family protein [Halanaeroarchaeum sp.]